MLALVGATFIELTFYNIELDHILIYNRDV